MIVLLIFLILSGLFGEIFLIAFLVSKASKGNDIFSHRDSRPINRSYDYGEYLKSRAGERGEYAVIRQLSRLENAVDGYTVYNDLMFRTRNGSTHQIDHLVVSRYGIFVIETKNWKGCIWGTETSPFWTLTKYNGSKTKLCNPIEQNEGHIRAINEILCIHPRNYQSIVCLVNPEKDYIEALTPVVPHYEIVDEIYSHNDVLLTDSQVDSINEEIQLLIEELDFTLDEHIYNVQNRNGNRPRY